MPTGFYSKKEFFECLSALQSLPQERFDTFLWLSPRILRWMPVENIFKLHNFKAIKIHCVAHPDWLLFPEKLSDGTFNNYLVLAALDFPLKENFNFSHVNTGVTLVQTIKENGVVKTKLKFLNDYSHLDEKPQL